MSFFTLGEVRPPNEEDFIYFQHYASDNLGWKRHVNKKLVQVYSKSATGSRVNLVKVHASLPDVSADDIYDMLHDNAYRFCWDKTSKEGYNIGLVAPNNVIEYYAIKSPFTLANRDYVLSRCWNIIDDKYIIFSRSVFHKQAPPRKEYIRAESIVTGYLISKTGPTSCDFTYLTHNDPRGNIPHWAVNLATTSLAPRIMKGVYRAALKYSKWKEENNPGYKPWRNPQQLSDLPPINMDDISEEPDFADSIIDESNVSERAAKDEEELEINQLNESDSNGNLLSGI